MAGLSVKGDPDGWLDAGRTIGTLMTQLENELSDANTASGAGLASQWRGPAASAFIADWNARRSRYEDLIYNARRAAQAITDYGEKLLGIVQKAANLESIWCGFGLHLLESGEGFMLPPGIESMPAGTQLSLTQALHESARDVEQLTADAVGAAEDLATALGSAIVALLDFDLIEVGVLRSAAAGVAHEYVKENFEGLLARAGFAIGELGAIAGKAADATSGVDNLLTTVALHGTPDEQATLIASGLPGDAHDVATATSGLSTGLTVGGYVALGAANFVTSYTVTEDAEREGLRASLEQNAGLIASTATSDAIAIAFPELGPVGVIAGGVVAAGVGYTVQTIVDHRQAIGHFIESVF